MSFNRTFNCVLKCRLTKDPEPCSYYGAALLKMPHSSSSEVIWESASDTTTIDQNEFQNWKQQFKYVHHQSSNLMFQQHSFYAAPSSHLLSGFMNLLKSIRYTTFVEYEKFFLSLGLPARDIQSRTQYCFRTSSKNRH